MKWFFIYCINDEYYEELLVYKNLITHEDMQQNVTPQTRPPTHIHKGGKHFTWLTEMNNKSVNNEKKFNFNLIENIFNGWLYLHLLFKLKQVKLPL